LTQSPFWKIENSRAGGIAYALAQNTLEVAGVMNLQDGGFAGYVAVPEP